MSAMIFHTAHLRVRPDALEAFRERVLRHARTCLDTEPGCRRFDIYQETENSTLFLLIEIYADDAALKEHRSSPTYLQWREDTKDWIVERTWWVWTKLGPEAPA
jgi:(4S)-4-hydroxy-5-phosphonooxypentane-2,3-dione isomerase